MTEQNNQNEHKVTLQEREAPKPINPVFWIGLLAVPLLLGLLVSLGSGAPELIEKPVFEWKDESTSARLQGGIGANNPVIAPRAAGETQPAQNAQAYTCNFDVWVGMKVEPEMLDALKGAHEGMGRPYRILEPGSAMTMDHSPARVNFDLNEAGAITRVWCG